MSSKLWGGRFSGELSDEALEFTQTVQIDQRLILSDLWGSVAHILMLSRQNILSPQEGRAIVGVLLDLEAEAQRGQLHLDRSLEDVHLNVETLLIRSLGLGVGGHLQTARSRNDQVVTDTRLYLRKEIVALGTSLVDFAQELLECSRGERHTLMLGYTHSQPAQPISFGFWLSGHASILLRDAIRLAHAYDTVNQNPLGACALAGTSFPIDRNLTTWLMGFDRVLVHALDATSTRDFILETASALSIFTSNTSRLAEEIVCWSDFEHRLFDVGDAFSTGSSIMPQKRNPVVAELVRARAGVASGALFELLSVVKGVSLGYSCDLQEDKPALWRALDTVGSVLSILRAQMRAIRYRPERAESLCWESFCTATEIANHLVREKAITFRDAYRLTGEVVKALSVCGSTLADSGKVVALFAEAGILLDETQVRQVADPALVLSKQTSVGATGPDAVAHTIDLLTDEAEKLADLFRERHDLITASWQRTWAIARGFVGGEDIKQLIDRQQTLSLQRPQ